MSVIYSIWLRQTDWRIFGFFPSYNAAVNTRCVYSGVAEVSVYVKQSEKGKGIGNILMSNLIELSEKHGYWTLQSGIFPENEVSIKLHLKHGFREVGRREKLGKMNDVWRDVLLLERRSSVVGQ